MDMMVYVSYACWYLLGGCLGAVLLDSLLVWIDRDMEMTSREKAWCVVAWPYLLTLSVFSFVEGLLEKK